MKTVLNFILDDELCVIPPPPGGYTVDYLKNMVSQAKFVRFKGIYH
ncbi:hypothetical protein SPBRAN_1145 [uncultured Candidatus Thioglobus sp.]|nr:hypothetical protein SPBRAN_1145 [uncultured Candidatus Thioglobus sp.]